MIKILNNREYGNIFHYAHFICDCLFPEIVNGIYKNKRIIREKSISQTLGNFLPLYCFVMNTKCIEVEPSIFNRINENIYINKTKEELIDIKNFILFRTYIFNRFQINPSIYYPKYPSVILIQRGPRKNLINDPKLNSINNNYTNGSERREIDEIEKVCTFMKEKYSDQMNRLILENIPFHEQIQYFNNAKLIVCAHGAAMSNLFFCKKNTIFVEITCGEVWNFFDKITEKLNIIHYKIQNNKYEEIINFMNQLDINLM